MRKDVNKQLKGFAVLANAAVCRLISVVSSAPIMMGMMA